MSIIVDSLFIDSPDVLVVFVVVYLFIYFFFWGGGGGGGGSSHIINNAFSALSDCMNILLRLLEVTAGCCNLNYVLLSSGCRCYTCVSSSWCQSLVVTFPGHIHLHFHTVKFTALEESYFLRRCFKITRSSNLVKADMTRKSPNHT